MISAAITILSVLLGYLITVGLSLAGTMAVTAAAPRFAVAEHRVRPSYKLVHEAMWFVCVILGAFAASRAGLRGNRAEQELALIAMLLFILWRNTWEARQRGTAHQILISLLTVLGVGVGYAAGTRINLP